MRHLFAGVNSPAGFHSYFKSIIDEEKAARIIYIKGGPGTGKSTLMKKIASAACDMGEPVEVFHCSSDPQSLVGVHIVNRRVALMDSTAPHIMEPKYPAVNGQIFNAAECLDRDKLSGREGELSRYCAIKETAFKRGFQYLKAAAAIDEMYDGESNTKKVDDIIELYIFQPSDTGGGRVRPLFLNAVTPDGPVSYQGGLREGGLVVTIPPAALNRLLEHATRNGYDAEVFFSPLNPKVKIEHIHIPELNLWISSEPPDDCDLRQKLIDGAVKAFGDARQAHRLMEDEIFIPAMDFDKLQHMAAQLAESLFSNSLLL